MTPARARAVLKAPVGAGRESLKRAYRAALKAAHPDLGGSDQRLREVLQAYGVLGSAGADIAGAQSATPAPAQAARVQISVEEALHGCRKTARVGGEYRVIDVPAGVRAGETLRLTPANSSADELFVRVSILPNDRLALRGDDLWLEVDSPLSGRVQIDTPGGKRWIWVTPKVGSRKLVRLAGEGLPARGARKAGDLFVRLRKPSSPRETPSAGLLRQFAQTWATG